MRWFLLLFLMTPIVILQNCSLPEGYGECPSPQGLNFTSGLLGCLRGSPPKVITACPFEEFSCVAILTKDSFIGGCVRKKGVKSIQFRENVSSHGLVKVEKTEEFRLVRGCDTFNKTCEQMTVTLGGEAFMTKVCCCSGTQCVENDPLEWSKVAHETNKTVVTITAVGLATSICTLLFSYLYGRYKIYQAKMMCSRSKIQ